jgi:hypothetical protein
MKKVTLTVPWGHIGSIFLKKKKQKKAQFVTTFSFSPNNILQHGLC